MNTFFRISTLLLHLIRFVYWTTTEIQTNREKPKMERPSTKKFVKRVISLSIGLIIAMQLWGVDILPFENTPQIQTIGFLFVVFGIFVSIAARKTLGSNWSHAAEYQIRKDQDLTTNGVYEYIRHPIYAGIFFAVLGAEIVAGSYLYIPVFILGALVGYKQAKSEEKILEDKFGKEYGNYLKSTKMFLPFIW